mmetsp:Transcript_96216/g.206506  ORF Transcript_96216/g.206506 Transcript_96216/m.206506 type:complete len:364 (-) Transcript_96216:180-1271(-)
MVLAPEDGTLYPLTFEMAARCAIKDLPVLEKGSWRKVRTLGEANYGKVYLAEGVLPSMPPHLVGGRGLPSAAPRTFALKQMRRRDVISGGKGLESAQNELHAALTLFGAQVPFTAQVLGLAQDCDYFYLATEYCAHGELFAVLQRAGRFKSEQVLREVISQVLQALQALHEAGVAHRDVSLENLLVADDGSLRLIDFGQAIMVHGPNGVREEALVPQSDMGLPGKPNYRAPEVKLGRPYSAKKADSYACGALLYTLVVGSYPFQGTDVASSYLFMTEGDGEICDRLGPQLRELGLEGQVSPGLLDLLEQLLAQRPEQRASVEEALAHPWLVGTLDGFYMPSDNEGFGGMDESESISDGHSMTF